MAKKAITKRFPGEHCGKVKVWSPTADAMSHSSVEVEGRLSPAAARMITALAIHGNRLEWRMLNRIEQLANDIMQVVKNEKGNDE
jgi:hypothetical protein